jgi:hypothetical protein
MPAFLSEFCLSKTGNRIINISTRSSYICDTFVKMLKQKATTYHWHNVHSALGGNWNDFGISKQMSEVLQSIWYL